MGLSTSHTKGAYTTGCFLSQMKLSCDDQSLFSVGEDGTMVCFTVMDKEGRMLKRDKDVPLAEEVLITRTDLEEKVSKNTCITMLTRLEGILMLASITHLLEIEEKFCGLCVLHIHVSCTVH